MILTFIEMDSRYDKYRKHCIYIGNLIYMCIKMKVNRRLIFTKTEVGMRLESCSVSVTGGIYRKDHASGNFTLC